MQQRVFTIAENAPVARDTYRLQLTGDTAAITAPGQFVDIRLAGRFLRRPVSVCSWSDGALTLYYKVAGAGTAQLSTLVPGTELDLLVGLGNGFDTAPAGARPLLVGGGVGASPLYGLAQQLVAEGCSPLAVLGFRTAAEVLLADAFEALGIPVTVVTEDGTMGARGFVTDALPEGGTYVYACGPHPPVRGRCWSAAAWARPHCTVWRSSSWPRGAARWPCSAFARRQRCCLPMRLKRSASPSRS